MTRLLTYINKRLIEPFATTNFKQLYMKARTKK